MNLIGLLIAVALAVGLAVLAKWLVDYFEFPPPLRIVALIVAGIICLIIILNQLGVAGQPIFRP